MTIPSGIWVAPLQWLRLIAIYLVAGICFVGSVPMPSYTPSIALSIVPVLLWQHWLSANRAFVLQPYLLAALFAPAVTMTLYVDDGTIESAGPYHYVKKSVVGATRHFSNALIKIGMEFSPTKNVVMASSARLADDIASGLHGLQ